MPQKILKVTPVRPYWSNRFHLETYLDTGAIVLSNHTWATEADAQQWADTVMGMGDTDHNENCPMHAYSSGYSTHISAFQTARVISGVVFPARTPDEILEEERQAKRFGARLRKRLEKIMQPIRYRIADLCYWVLRFVE